MRVCKLRNLWLIVKTVTATLRYSLAVLVAVARKRCTRAVVNQICGDWSKRLLAILKTNYTVRNSFHAVIAEDKSYIVMSNHASHYDIPLIFMAFPNVSIRMIAKKELFRVPVWGHAMKAAEFVAIDRENRKQALLDLNAARAKMQSGIVPWIAPEGTRSRTGKMQAFKKGGFMLAISTGATIIPVGIKGSGKILPPKTLHFGVGENVVINIGEPIATAGFTAKDVRKLMLVVENSIHRLANN